MFGVDAAPRVSIRADSTVIDVEWSAGKEPKVLAVGLSLSPALGNRQLSQDRGHSVRRLAGLVFLRVIEGDGAARLPGDPSAWASCLGRGPIRIHAVIARDVDLVIETGNFGLRGAPKDRRTRKVLPAAIDTSWVMTQTCPSMAPVPALEVGAVDTTNAWIEVHSPRRLTESISNGVVLR